MINVLITGGAGFIGRHLADYLTGVDDVAVNVIDNESLGGRRHLYLQSAVRRRRPASRVTDVPSVFCM
ncbi:MAG TPA: NAD-dependent epimerase/dehydratase family protein [Nocardioidaceae bacterium]|nr:NAD-dependent epimerase/dehydratase family protein [Nocardioidaceae bacterium]